MRIDLAPGLRRTARFIEVPDIRLFPDFLKARSVMFRSGMELGILIAGMAATAALRRRWPIDITPNRAEALMRLTNLLLPSARIGAACGSRWRAARATM